MFAGLQSSSTPIEKQFQKLLISLSLVSEAKSQYMASQK